MPLSYCFICITMPYSGCGEQSWMHKRLVSIQPKQKLDLCDEYSEGSSSSVARDKRIRQEDCNYSQS